MIGRFQRFALRCTVAAAAAFAAAGGSVALAQGFNVTTHHYNNLRTGWNQSETMLTPASMQGDNFGYLGQISVDEQVDAQPLLVSGVQISGGTHDVLYVATENNTIYAIDANSGAILMSQNYGAAVPYTALPGQCLNSSYNLGINSTPAIDLAAKTMYAITYTYDNNTTPTFRIHAIDITTLQDKVAPVAVSASNSFHKGGPLAFKSANNRQRAGLIETGGNIYAGFASWCDINSDVSRGWVLGWNASTLTPLPANKLLDQRKSSADNFFLTSVWMSGYGIASPDDGSIYFVTGNSDYSGTSYNSKYNLDESVVHLSGDLTTVDDFFTPDSGQNGWSPWDQGDQDFGAAGVLLLPDQPGAYPHLAIAAGKAGPMYFLNRDQLGHLTQHRKSVLGQYENGGCWCGQSYYTGADGIGRVVESTGTNVIVWKVVTSPKTKLVFESQSPGLNNMQDPGFFTTISSSGTTANSQVVWAIEHPSDPNTNYVWLKAFDPSNGSAQIFAEVAGVWPFACCTNASLVPIVANGRVYVASYGVVTAFGLGGTAARHGGFTALPRPPLPLPPGIAHELRGTVTAINANAISLRLRNGRVVTVDIGTAMNGFHMAPPSVGHASLVRGDYAGAVFKASYVLHQKDNLLTWAPDR
jgi:hypothetical protein